MEASLGHQDHKPSSQHLRAKWRDALPTCTFLKLQVRSVFLLTFKSVTNHSRKICNIITFYFSLEGNFHCFQRQKTIAFHKYSRHSVHKYNYSAYPYQQSYRGDLSWPWIRVKKQIVSEWPYKPLSGPLQWRSRLGWMALKFMQHLRLQKCPVIFIKGLVFVFPSFY